MTLGNKSIFVAMRHENSVNAVWGWATSQGIKPQNFHYVILERKIDPEAEFVIKIDEIKQGLRNTLFDVLVIATKVYDRDDSSQLIPFLTLLKENGVGQIPIVLTHLEKLEDSVMDDIRVLGLNVHIVNNDNLGMPKEEDKATGIVRTGMSQLGKKILEVL